MKKVINKSFELKTKQIDDIINDFDTRGEEFGNQDRNILKVFNLDDMTVNVKSFRIPNIVNRIAYKFFRKSKAQRSFEFAKKLLELEVGTPNPIAYYEFKTPLLFKESYYISEHLDYDLTYRELTTNFKYPDHETILRSFTRFTYDLHQKGINFLDHSPGNTLIRKVEENYKFYLVDLNRMKFEPMDFKKRMKNMSKLTIHKHMVEIICDEYSKCSGENYNNILNTVWNETQKFQFKFHRRRRLKQKLKFWK
ncbi:MAG: Kdo domain containing protein [Bacteroidia bacterium]|nr:Kdo domain containing protein [Bacteroidia bacterium]